MTRICGTPGCSLKDFHLGPCSVEVVNTSRMCSPCSTISISPTRKENQFQHGYDFFCMAIQDQQGVDVRLPFDLSPDNQQVCGKIIGLSKKKILGVEIDILGFGKLDLHVQDLMRHDVVVSWKKPSADTIAFHNRAFDATYKSYNTCAAKRMKCIVKTLRQTYCCKKKHLFLSLDGKGANYDAFHKEYQDASAPRFVIFEKDPLVACNQKLLYGNDDVIYTGGMMKERFGYGNNNAPPGIEYLISTRAAKGVENTLFTQNDCDQTVALYLDYCGGIMGGLDFDTGQHILTELLSRLPRL